MRSNVPLVTLWLWWLLDLSRGWTVFGASGAVVFAALTGLALMWLLRRS